MLRLAGSRVNPKTNGPHNPQNLTGITLKMIADGWKSRWWCRRMRESGLRVFAGWKMAAFAATRSNGIELWLADTATGLAKALTGATVSGLGGFDWLDDSSALLVRFVPAGRGPLRYPRADRSAHSGVSRQGSAGATFQDLLTSAYDEALYETLHRPACGGHDNRRTHAHRQARHLCHGIHVA